MTAEIDASNANGWGLVVNMDAWWTHHGITSDANAFGQLSGSAWLRLTGVDALKRASGLCAAPTRFATVRLRPSPCP